MLGVMSWPSLSAGGHDLTVKLFVVFFFLDILAIFYLVI
jgi:hypothetical protein